MNELALFAGAGGGILGGRLMGWRTVCAVERDAYAAQVLSQRQNDGALEAFPIWSDVCSFDGRPWRGIVDVVSGGFPCQDISQAGSGAGIEGGKSGLWKQMARVIDEVRPRFVFVENSGLLVSRGLAVVISDLAEMGYDCEWNCLSGAYAGAPQSRERLWLVAYSDSVRLKRIEEWDVKGKNAIEWHNNDGLGLAQRRARDAASRVSRMDDAVANGMDRLKATGNGQIPKMAARAFRYLSR